MTVLQNLIANSLLNSVDPIEVKEAFEAYTNSGIGFSAGFIEDRWIYDFPYYSKEHKLAQKIVQFSYQFHALDNDLNYIIPENEHK
jgi:hypothetical protein